MTRSRRSYEVSKRLDDGRTLQERLDVGFELRESIKDEVEKTRVFHIVVVLRRMPVW